MLIRAPCSALLLINKRIKRDYDKHLSTTITNPSGLAQRGKRMKIRRVLITPHGDSQLERV
ncbi:hypothetical protein NYA30BAC_00479 [Halomonas sp. NYA30]